jgi:hypothetical protein
LRGQTFNEKGDLTVIGHKAYEYIDAACPGGLNFRALQGDLQQTACVVEVTEYLFQFFIL